jgi:monoamine oxidase
MDRRTFLLGSLAGLGAVTLASCTGMPEPTVSPTTTPDPTSTIGGLPAPTAFRRSRWSADPFARGAYSFTAVGATPELREALAEPVLDRLFFAGEATSVSAPGTIEGARTSGGRAARRVAQAAAPEERIAVIGAGVAGLTAARTLVDLGYEVVLIEARQRLGGRIDGEVVASLGVAPAATGMVIPETARDLIEELREADVTTRPFDPLVEARTGDGVAVPIPPTGEDAITAATAWARAQPNDVSLAAALVSSGVTAELASAPAGEEGVPATAWLRHAIVTGVQPATGGSTTEVSAQHFTLPGWFAGEGGLRMVIDGMSNWIEALAEGLDAVVDSAVIGIAYGEERVSIRFDTGESLNVDRAIVTVPIGVLQTDTLRFEPGLPLHHQRAISTLGMGAVDTVWLRFDEAFWRTDAHVLTVVAAPSSVGLWVDVGASSGEPILLGIIAAADALRLEDVEDDDFLDAVLTGLRPYAPPER